MNEWVAHSSMSRIEGHRGINGQLHRKMVEQIEPGFDRWTDNRQLGQVHGCLDA